MERLTEKGYQYHSCDFMEDGIFEWANKLREYEDAEEQGLLLRLPVAIGSTLYQKRKDNMIEFKTIGIIHDILSKEWLYEVAVQSGVDWIKTVCSMESVGKTVFLTKEEAERALKEREQND